MTCVHYRTCVVCGDKTDKYIRLCGKRAEILSRWLGIRVTGNGAAHEECLGCFGLRALPSVAQVCGTKEIPVVREIQCHIATVVQDVRATKGIDASEDYIRDAAWQFVREKYRIRRPTCDMAKGLESFVGRTVSQLCGLDTRCVDPVVIPSDTSTVAPIDPVGSDNSEVQN